MDLFGVDLSAIVTFVPSVLEAAFATVAFASAITALTPTPRDDELAGKLYKILEWIALNVGAAKELPPNKAGGRFTAE